MKFDPTGADAALPAANGLPQAAIGWLREILRSEFAAEAEITAAPRDTKPSGGFRPEEWVRLAARVRVLGSADPPTSRAGEELLTLVLDRARAVVEHGEALTLVAIAIPAEDTEESECYRALSAVTEVLRQESGSCGIVLHRGALELLLVLPQVDGPQAEVLVVRARDRLGVRGRFHAGIVQCTAEITSAEQLLALAARALADGRG